jgi:hypothetical protein
VGTDETFIKVTKGEDEELGFSDGFELNFNYTMPEHLRFYYSATNVETEQANLRLKDGEVFLKFIIKVKPASFLK